MSSVSSIRRLLHCTYYVLVQVAGVFSSLTEWEDTLKELRTQIDTMRENCINFQVRARISHAHQSIIQQCCAVESAVR